MAGFRFAGVKIRYKHSEQLTDWFSVCASLLILSLSSTFLKSVIRWRLCRVVCSVMWSIMLCSVECNAVLCDLRRLALIWNVFIIMPYCLAAAFSIAGTLYLSLSTLCTSTQVFRVSRLVDVCECCFRGQGQGNSIVGISISQSHTNEMWTIEASQFTASGQQHDTISLVGLPETQLTWTKIMHTFLARERVPQWLWTLLLINLFFCCYQIFCVLKLISVSTDRN